MDRSRPAANRPRRPAGRLTRRLALPAALGLCKMRAVIAPAHADAPMSYLVESGSRGYPVEHLLWALLIVSVLVILIVSALVIAGLARRRDVPRTSDPRVIPPERPDRGLSWIYVGSAISVVVLVGAAIWTFSTLAATSGPPRNAKVTIEVIGHQWWWEARYSDGTDLSREFTTANELHIPTGEPVRLKLVSADVIHSFWVPKLSGKTDLIPGQQNETWFEADRAGTYRGQCGEYCGLQHAHMALSVVAEPRAQFEAWWTAQLQPPSPPQSKTAAAGQADFTTRCGICHSVRGTAAGGRLGPDLSHLMTRTTLAAGTLPNSPGYLAGWMADPQHAKPGNLMPILDLTGRELTDIRDYLQTLK